MSEPKCPMACRGKGQLVVSKGIGLNFGCTQPEHTHPGHPDDMTAKDKERLKGNYK